VFNPIRIETKTAGSKRNVSYKVGTTYEKNAAIRSGVARKWVVKKYKTKGNIWFYTIGSKHTTKDKEAYGHPAVFPEKLAYDHIISWSNKRDIVLDPLCGSGTTLKMAEKLNRKWIGIDISREYCEIAKQRIKSLV